MHPEPGGPERPIWALPTSPPAPSSARRWLLIGLAAALLLLPSAMLPGSGGTDELVRAASLAVAGLAGLVAASALLVLAGSVGDRRLRWTAAGFAAVPVLVVLRAVTPVDPTTAAPGGADAALALLQALAVPLAVLAALLLSAHRSRAALAAIAVLLLAAPAVAVAALILPTGGPSPVLRGLELAVAVVATVAVLLWVRRMPEGNGSGWVATGLGLLVLGRAGAALVEQRTGPVWWAVLALTDLALVVPAAGLELSSCAPYRRQLRRWRQLETCVRAARASSPLLPGLSVSPDEDEALPRPDELDEVLAAGQVDITLQPVIALDGGAVLGVEALARFRGRLPPDRWFRAARLDGRGAQLELLALRSALAHLEALPAGFLAVNLSPAALTDPGVLEALRGVDLSRLVVEVTEHDAVGDHATARQGLDALREAGARTAVHDTGAGFASLRHVLALQPDIVKLDHSLTRGVEHDPRQREMVAALARFAAAVGVVLVAEGVETEQQAQALGSLGLTAAQGFHLGVPAVQRPGGSAG